jgi:hypothetical protein
MLILSTFTIVALVINFIVILIILAKLNRQMDGIVKVMKSMEKRIAEEDHFIIKINESVSRLEKGLYAKNGGIDWKG